jgi:hypothetical protein
MAKETQIHPLALMRTRSSAKQNRMLSVSSGEFPRHQFAEIDFPGANPGRVDSKGRGPKSATEAFCRQQQIGSIWKKLSVSILEFLFRQRMAHEVKHWNRKFF